MPGQHMTKLRVPGQHMTKLRVIDYLDCSIRQ